jgi:uncharacterized membrane protein YdjX (TVP38/TMEM64 family)
MKSHSIKRSIWFWLTLATAVVGLTLLSYSETFRNLLEWATGWAKDVIASNPVMGALVFLLFSMLSAMLAFASSAVLVPAANLVFGKLVTFLLLWGGWVAGSIVAYAIGRQARPLLIRLGYQRTLEKYQEYVSRRTKFWMVLMFCFAVPSEIPGYVLGGVHYPFWRFLSAIAATEAIYALGLVFAGEKLLAAKRLDLILILGALIVIGAGAGLLFRKLRKRRSVESHSR